MLLATKLYMPSVKSDLVPRPRLIARLSQGMARSLTLVSAPAGFGKTTLVSDWLRFSEHAAAWLSLDEADNDPLRFTTYLAAALLGKARVSEVPSIESLINEMDALAQPTVLVLDDYHRIQNLTVHQLTRFLLANRPPSLHLVILTREDPPLPLSRLRVREALTELRAADLRFTRDEAGAFFQKRQPTLTPDEIATLDNRTEGWAAGLQLAALSMQGRTDHKRFIHDFAGDDRHVTDYLIDEVISQQSKEVQQFLQYTSVLEQFCGPLCNAVCNIQNGQAILEHLERANLFIVPLDHRRDWYRYHALFSDLLHHRLRRFEPGAIPNLHRRASAWYEQQNLILEAVRHALAAQDIERVVYLIEEHALSMIAHEALNTFLRQLRKLPADLVHARPQLSVAYAWGLVYAGQFEALNEQLRDTEAALTGAIDETERNRVAGHIATIRAYAETISGGLERALAFSDEALARLPADDLRARGFAVSTKGAVLRGAGRIAEALPYLERALAISQEASDEHSHTVVLCELGLAHLAQAQLHRAASHYRTALDEVETYRQQHGRSLPAAAYVYARLGEVLYEWNALDEAEHHVQRSIALGEPWGQVVVLTLAYNGLARVLQANGKGAEALDAVRQSQRFLDEVPAHYILRLKALEACIWLSQGNLEAAAQWAQQTSIDATFQYALLPVYHTLARVWMAQNQAHKALVLLQKVHAAIEAAGWHYARIGNLALQALALAAQNQTDEAIGTLSCALRRAEPAGCVRVFVDEGQPMARLLYQAAEEGAAYAGKLLTAFAEAPEAAPNGIEPLSTRELDVLHLLAEGLSNQEIAVQLVLSKHTIKSHNRNIYNKLGAENRTQAVLKAKALGIIDSS